MKYYSISQQVGLTKGVTFQLTPLKENDISMLFWDEFPEITPKLYFDLEENAYVTDILSQATINQSGFVISARLKEILSKFNLVNHELYALNIGNLNEANDFHWLNLVPEKLHLHIDYSKSNFYTTELGFQEDDIVVNSFSDYKEKLSFLKSDFSIESDLIFFEKGFHIPYDLFVISYFDDDIYVSERLVEVLKKNNISGYELDEFDKIQLQTNS